MCTTDSARFVDWKVTAKSGRLMVREFAREDERRVMLVLDPFSGRRATELGRLAAAEHAERFERAVSLAACIAWHFNEIHSVMQFRTNRFSTPMAPAGEIIYDTLRELALIEADTSAAGGAFLDDLAAEHDIFKIILTSPRRSTPSPPASGPPPISSSSTACNQSPSTHSLRQYRPHAAAIYSSRAEDFSAPPSRAGFARIAAISPGARAAIPIASGSRKSCCSRRASPPCCPTTIAS